MRRVVLSTALLCAAACLVPVTSFAQVAIAGVVKDGTGAVLPGVTVEASSPALIEKSRSAVSDAAGQYKIVDLVPGTYEVAFTLAGFKTVRRTRHHSRRQFHRAGERRSCRSARWRRR